MARFVLENCLCFDGVELRRSGVLTNRMGTQHTCKWRRTGGSDCTINYTVLELSPSARVLRLSYFVFHGASGAERKMEYVVMMSSTPCRFGGRRFWLRCPLVRNGVRCNRTVLRLYLPPGGQMFGCRHCYNLTYHSVQSHDKRVDAMARHPELLPLFLQSPNIRVALRAVAVVSKTCAAFSKALGAL